MTLLDIKPPIRMRRVRTEEKIAAVAAIVDVDRDLYIRRWSQKLGLCTTCKFMLRDLQAYKQLVPELKSGDPPM